MAEQTKAQLLEEIDRLKEEIRGLQGSLKAYRGSTTKAKREVTILKAQLSPQARPIGALKPAKSEEEATRRAEALEAAFAGDMLQIVFSDGKREIRELEPLLVNGAAWRQTPHHRELDADPIVQPFGEKESYSLHGFGLLNEDGDQVGYHALPTPIVIGRSQRMRLPHGIIRF